MGVLDSMAANAELVYNEDTLGEMVATINRMILKNE